MDSKEKEPFRGEESWIGTEDPIENELHEDTGGFISGWIYGWISPLLSIGTAIYISSLFPSLSPSTYFLPVIPHLLLYFVCALKIRQGNKRPLELEDLGELHWTNKAANVFGTVLGDHIEARLGRLRAEEEEDELKPAVPFREEKQKPPASRLNLWLVLLRCFGLQMVLPPQPPKPHTQ